MNIKLLAQRGRNGDVKLIRDVGADELAAIPLVGDFVVTHVGSRRVLERYFDFRKEVVEVQLIVEME